MPCTSREGRPIPSPRRRRLGLALAGAAAATLCATPAWPQTAAAKPKIAVVSAIGDVLTVVTYTPSVGSRVNRNAQETLPLADALFDVIANDPNAGFRPAGSAGLPKNFTAAADVNGQTIRGMQLGFVYKF